MSTKQFWLVLSAPRCPWAGALSCAPVNNQDAVRNMQQRLPRLSLTLWRGLALILRE